MVAMELFPTAPSHIREIFYWKGTGWSWNYYSWSSSTLIQPVDVVDITIFSKCLWYFSEFLGQLGVGLKYYVGIIILTVAYSFERFTNNELTQLIFEIEKFFFFKWVILQEIDLLHNQGASLAPMCIVHH